MAEERSSWRELRKQRMNEPGARQAYEAARLAFSLGAKVRHLRETRGWSQTELARQSDMAQSAIARFEAGGTVPTLPLLYRLTRALGVSLVVEINEPGQQPSRSALRTAGRGTATGGKATARVSSSMGKTATSGARAAKGKTLTSGNKISAKSTSSKEPAAKAKGNGGSSAS